MNILVTVIIISTLTATLAAALVLAERFIANYGECKITLNNKRTITVKGGKPLLSVLRDEKIFIPSACGGRGTCGLCKLKALEGAGPVSPTEAPFLTKEEIANNIRLSCQIKVRNDIALEMPEHLFNVREFQVRCQKIEDLTHDMKRFKFDLLNPTEMQFVAGQYIQLLCPRYPGNSEEVYRAYSISSAPHEKGYIELIIRKVPHGICTTWCFEHLKVGDTTSINGPYGEFQLSRTEAPMIFLAGGSGMAPFVSILRDMREAGSTRKAVYFFGANTERDLCLQAEMQSFERELPDFKFIPVVSRPENGKWDGETGLVTEAVKRDYEDLKEYEGYLCGSPGMIEAAAEIFKSIGMPEDRIYYDKFA